MDTTFLRFPDLNANSIYLGGQYRHCLILSRADILLQTTDK